MMMMTMAMAMTMTMAMMMMMMAMTTTRPSDKRQWQAGQANSVQESGEEAEDRHHGRRGQHRAAPVRQTAQGGRGG